MATTRKSIEKSGTKTATKTAPAKKRTPPKGATKSANTKTAANRRHITGGDTHKTPGKKSAKKTEGGNKPSSANACWPGYEPTPGKMQGEKGSCEPKAHQTSAQKKGDQKAAAASKLSGQRK